MQDPEAPGSNYRGPLAAITSETCWESYSIESRGASYMERGGIRTTTMIGSKARMVTGNKGRGQHPSLAVVQRHHSVARWS